MREYGTLTTDPTYECWPSSRLALFDLDYPPADRYGLMCYIDADPGVSNHVEHLYESAETALSFGEWLDDDEVIEEVRWEIERWLDEHPDEYDWERADLTGITGQGYALCYFRDEFEYCAEFDIAIIEGEHPGSSYYAAELRMPVDEANKLAEQMGLPIRFAGQGF